MFNQKGIVLYESAARVATPTAPAQDNLNHRALHVIIDVTAIADSPSVVPTIDGFDPLSGKWYTLLTGAAIVGTGTTILKVGPGITPATNLAVSDFLPARWRLVMTHGDGDSITYTAAANVMI